MLRIFINIFETRNMKFIPLTTLRPVVQKILFQFEYQDHSRSVQMGCHQSIAKISLSEKNEHLKKVCVCIYLLTVKIYKLSRE